MSIDVVYEVATALDRHGLLGADFLVGVSGGVDSVCLHHVLQVLRKRHGGRLEVAHVDHASRHSSAGDAEFCRGLAGCYGSVFHLVRLDESQLCTGEGFQAAARRARRVFFETLLRERDLTCIALAHHADDQVETVLSRLLRGAGLRGAAGMREFAPPYVRPLLGVSRRDLEALAAAQSWEYREDPTNRTDRYARNRLRQEALPALRRVHPGADAGLLRFARLAAEDDRVLTGLAREAVRELSVPEPEGVRLPLDELAELELGVRRRVYLTLWRQGGGEVESLSAGHLDEIDRLLAPGRAHRFAPLPGSLRFAVSYRDLWLLRPYSAVTLFEKWIPAPGGPPVAVPGGVLRWERELPQDRGGVAVPAPAVRGVLARARKPGDRVAVGGHGPRKVKDLLMEDRVPLWRRDQAIVLQCEDGPFGVLGVRLALSGKDSSGGWCWLEPASLPSSGKGF